MRIWRTLCEHFFQRVIGEDQVIADLACGYGEFINNIRAKEKYAVDLNDDVRANLAKDVVFYRCSADSIPAIRDESIDVVFASNFLEHLRTSEECDAVFAEVWRMLKPNGRFLIMGPNIRYLGAQYWDFYDHCLPLSHLSLEEGLVQAGYQIKTMIPRFLPYTTRSRLPRHPALIACYLKMPLAWRFLGKQFFVVAGKPVRITAPA